MTHSLDLYFVKPEKEFPGPPQANVYVKTHSRDEGGPILITPNCVSLAEFEYEIKRLQNELDDILKKAKRNFATVR